MRTWNAILATSSQFGLQLWLLCLLPKFCFLPGTERERGRESVTGGYQSVLLSCCEECSVFDDITVSLKMDYCCVKRFKCFWLHCCLLEDDCCCAGRVKHWEFDKCSCSCCFGLERACPVCYVKVQCMELFSSSRKLDLWIHKWLLWSPKLRAKYVAVNNIIKNLPRFLLLILFNS